jgi:hypothetical protein
MSAVTLLETSIKSDLSRHVNQRMFTIGCGQSLAKRWLAASDEVQQRGLKATNDTGQSAKESHPNFEAEIDACICTVRGTDAL